MIYYIDSVAISMEEVKAHLQEVDLVPSRRSLLDNIDAKFKVLKEHNVLNLADLRNKVKDVKRIDELSKAIQIDFEFLNLLRREIESWFPKPLKLKDFTWLDESDIEKLVSHKYTNSQILLESIASSSDLENIAQFTGVNVDVLDEVVQLCKLTRIQWVSPTFARMLILGKYETVEDIASADAEALYVSMVRVNEEKGFFKGKIGLRDIKRLKMAAAFFANHCHDC